MRTRIVWISMFVLVAATAMAPTVAADPIFSCIPEDPNCCEMDGVKGVVACVKHVSNPDPCYVNGQYVC